MTCTPQGPCAYDEKPSWAARNRERQAAGGTGDTMNLEEQADIRRTIERLYDEKDELRRRISELEAELASLQEDEDACSGALEQADRALLALKAERDEAVEKVERRDAFCLELAAENAELQAERDKLRAELQQTCSAAYDETARLRAERDELRERDCCRLPDGRPV